MTAPLSFLLPSSIAAGILPGEDPAAFKQLHRDLIAELVPNGALENSIVERIAELVWRWQNLETLRIAKLARDHYEAILNGKYEELEILDTGPAEIGQASRGAEDKARKDLGDIYKLVEIGEAATFVGLGEDLAIHEKLCAAINKCLKQLLFVRGLKSVSAVSLSAPEPRIAGAEKIGRIAGPEKNGTSKPRDSRR
jgi:hypothetical protein